MLSKFAKVAAAKEEVKEWRFEVLDGSDQLVAEKCIDTGGLHHRTLGPHWAAHPTAETSSY